MIPGSDAESVTRTPVHRRHQVADVEDEEEESDGHGPSTRAIGPFEALEHVAAQEEDMQEARESPTHSSPFFTTQSQENVETSLRLKA